MGLDQYAFRVRKKAVVSDIAFKEKINKEKAYEELYYWRKVPRLQGFMENLYQKKGGTEVFNCKVVRVEENDLDALEKDVKAKKLPETYGFFFGEHYEEDMPSVLDFIKKARAVLKEGDAVYYSSWW
jgi:hypothetical protein